MPAKGTSKFVVTQEILEKVETLAGQGLTHDQIGQVLGVSERTVFSHKEKNMQFAQAIRRGQAKGVATVANSLFTSAKKGNVVAQIFFLTNRDPLNWKDRRHVDQTIRKDPEHTEIKKSMTAQEAAGAYADTLKNGTNDNVVNLKRRK